MQIPSSIDDEQGCIGDCYLISALGAIADSNPAAIENMIIPNGVENGIASYTVRFYYQNATTGVYVPDYVTVNAFMPTFSDGCVVFANPGPNGSWWMPIVEKAYAQWNETGHEGRDGTNTYVALADGWMDIVDEQVLGTAATDYFPKASDLTTEAALVSAIQGGEAVTAAIFLGNGDPNAFTQLQLVSGHAYEIAGYDAASQTFQLENPWGCYEPAPLTWSQFSTYCAWAAVANTSSTITASSVSAGATTATSAATDVEAHATELGAVRNRQSVNDAALLAYLDGNQNLHAQDTTTDAYARALERVLAELGRDVK
jgi:hypothetical protein